ncbi:hypothetical protein [Streptomyces pristinaespiralis]|uniref:hypothetical protein n=1 Tax=Streptomyces pristinaespiralis TaxID=38300 RepID=UPI0038374B26
MIASKLQWPIPQGKWSELLGLIGSKLTGRGESELFDAVQAFPGQPHLLSKDPEIKAQVKRLEG